MASITQDKRETDSSVDHEAEGIGNITFESGNFCLKEAVKPAFAPLKEAWRNPKAKASGRSEFNDQSRTYLGLWVDSFGR